MDAFVEGELSPIPGNIVRSYYWTDADGFRVEVDGGSVRGSWLVCPVDASAAWQRMKGDVESRLLVETLETGVPHRVRWSREWTQNPLQTTSHHSFNVGAWVARRESEPLANQTDAPSLLARLEHRDALDLYREAMVLTEEHWDAALARAFVAIEVLVLPLVGDARRGGWRTAGQWSRYGRRKAFRLWLSFQAARHADDTYSRAELRKIKCRPLSFGQCLEEAGRFLEKLMDYRRRHPNA